MFFPDPGWMGLKVATRKDQPLEKTVLQETLILNVVIRLAPWKTDPKGNSLTRWRRGGGGAY